MIGIMTKLKMMRASSKKTSPTPIYLQKFQEWILMINALGQGLPLKSKRSMMP